MATNEQQRRNQGKANEAARRSTGAGNESARQSIASANQSRRTGANTVDDINSLIRQPPRTRTLPTIEARGGVPATKGVGTYTPPTRPAGGGGGIASPLTETAYSDREYYASGAVLPSSDGLLSFKVRPIKQITQTDSNNATVVQIFAEPPAAEAP